MPSYRECQDRALRRARGEDPTPDKSRPAREVLAVDGQLTPGKKQAPPGVASSRGPAEPPRVRGLPWIKGMPKLCADCRGAVTTTHAGTAPERACRKCGWRYRFDNRQQAWELIEG